jgi:hypothetical protein
LLSDGPALGRSDRTVVFEVLRPFVLGKPHHGEHVFVNVGVPFEVVPDRFAFPVLVVDPDINAAVPCPARRLP